MELATYGYWELGGRDDISNVYGWGTTIYYGENIFVKQNTVKTKITVPSYTDTTYVTPETYPGNNGYEMIGEDQEKGVLLTDTTEEQNTFTIVGNNITRMRIYVWLEGQDVDCINYASHGGGITVNLGLQKDGIGSNTITTPTPTEIPTPETGVLMASTLGEETSTYLNGTIARNQIESVSFVKGTGLTEGVVEQFDASDGQDGSVTGYYTDTDGDGVYELTLASEDTIYANSYSGYLFHNLTNLTEINFDNFETITAIDMEGMFKNCYNLESLNLSKFNTSKVSNMSYMFGLESNWGARGFEPKIGKL